MGWKGAIRTLGAAARASEREAKRRQRELAQRQKQIEKMQDLEHAAYEVEVYENQVALLTSIHKECGDDIDWKASTSTPEPVKPVNERRMEDSARSALQEYRPSLLDRVFNREIKIRTRLENAIDKAVEDDTEAYSAALAQWEAEHLEWEESSKLCQQILNGEAAAKLEVIQRLDPFSEISTLGSEIQFRVENDSMIIAMVRIHGSDIIPTETKSLTKSGKLSSKKMPKGQFNELHQDYVCSCVIRIARELFAILPESMVIVTAVDELLNSRTGHMEEVPILSAAIPRDTLLSLNFENIDPSDSMGNFVHNMDFKKASGFSSVLEVSPSTFEKS